MFKNTVLFANKKLNNLEFIQETEILTFRGYRNLIKILHEINFNISNDEWEYIQVLYNNFDEHCSLTEPYYEEQEKYWNESLRKLKEKEYKIYDFDVLDVLRAKKEEIERDFDLLMKSYTWEQYRALNRFKDAQMAIHYANLIDNANIGDDHEYRHICHSIKVCEANLGMNQIEIIDVDGAKRTSITQLFEVNGIKVKRGFCCCPFHGEDTPSCKVYEKSQSFYCFGCGEGGSTIDFVMKYLKMDFADAVNYLNGI